MNTSIPIKGQNRTVQPTSPVQVIVVALIYTALLMMSFFIISMNPHEIPYSSYLIASIVASFALVIFITSLLYNGISVIDEKPSLGSIFKFRKLNFFSWKYISAFVAPTEGLGGIILMILLWAVASIVVTCVYYIFWPLVTGITILFGYLVYFVFFKPLKSIFAVADRCKGSLINGIILGLFFTVLYNVILLILGLIAFGIYNA